MICLQEIISQFVKKRKICLFPITLLTPDQFCFVLRGQKHQMCTYNTSIKKKMLSYLSNRHYHLLTKEFPDELKIDQPKVVYLPAHNGFKKEEQVERKPTAKLKLKRSRQMLDTSEFGDCCPICLSTDNISVDYYGKKHVCVKCRKLMRDEHGNQIRIFLNELGEIICLGFKVLEQTEKGVNKIYYYTDYTKLEINGRSAFATFARPDEMVVILRAVQAA